jgi:hypothetical protein
MGSHRSIVLGGLSVASLFVALSATGKVPSAASSPIDPPGVWRWVWIVGVVAAFALYGMGVWRIRSERDVRLAAVLLVAVVMQLAALSGPLLLSTDVFAYWSYGRVASVYQMNPYSETPAMLESGQPGYNPGLNTTIYGPGFTAASELHARAVGTSLRGVEVVYRVAAALGMLMVLAMVSVGVSRPGFAVAFIGWNPLLALHFAGGGHNDVLMLAFVVAGVLLARRRRPVMAGAAWAASAFVKASSLGLLPLEALASARSEQTHRGRFLGSFLIATLVFAALATLRYGTAWPSFIHRASTQLSQTSSVSLVYRAGELGVPRSIAKASLGMLFAIGYLKLLRDAWRGRARLGLAATFLILTPAWLVPWYGSWPVALAALEDDLTAQVIAVLATAYLLSDAIPIY